MKEHIKHIKWLTGVLTVMGGIASVHAQYSTDVITSFPAGFALSATYANWNDTGDPSSSGYSSFNGGTGYEPTFTANGSGFEVNAEGYGSSAYNLPTAFDAPGATEVELIFTINSPNTTDTDYMGPNFDLSDGTHQVQYLDYNPYPSPSGTTTFTVIAPLNGIDPTDITAFNLEMDPAGYGGGTPYDITYDSLAVLTPTPEPATFALAGMAATAFLAMRRRK